MGHACILGALDATSKMAAGLFSDKVPPPGPPGPAAAPAPGAPLACRPPPRVGRALVGPSGGG